MKNTPVNTNCKNYILKKIDAKTYFCMKKVEEM